MRHDKGAAMKRWTIVAFTTVVAFSVLAYAFVFGCRSLLSPAYPHGPSARERATVVARFAAARPVLERIVASEFAYPPTPFPADSSNREAWVRHHQYVDSLAIRIAQPGSPREARVFRRVWMKDNAQHPGVVGPVYVATWSHRGWGFDAPWWYAGYVYAPSGLPSEVDEVGSSPWSPCAGRYEHLDGAWWAFSVDDPQGRWSPDSRSRAAAIPW
jgi:hypothetical protein